MRQDAASTRKILARDEHLWKNHGKSWVTTTRQDLQNSFPSSVWGRAVRSSASRQPKPQRSFRLQNRTKRSFVARRSQAELGNERYDRFRRVPRAGIIGGCPTSRSPSSVSSGEAVSF